MANYAFALLLAKGMDVTAHEEGWRGEVGNPSLGEVHRSIPVTGRTWLRRMLAFIGPGYLIAVGYMDPGNWYTDIAGGSAYKYTLLSVVVFSSILAIFLQALSAKLGLVTGRDLAQACRDSYPKAASNLLWISAEIAIVACDLAEVIGAAIALNLLFGLPLMIGVIVTALDVLIVLALQHRGFRWVEALVMLLIGSMIVAFTIETVISRPVWSEVFQGLKPSVAILQNREMLFVSLGILGATVMPHNLYLHSSIIQTRAHDRSEKGVLEAIRMAYTDSTIALTLALFVNAAILVVAAAVFFKAGHTEVADIQSAYHLLTPLLGVSIAAPLFAVALLASGQNSTLTGTLAGQVILEGFTKFRMEPWLRRMVSRLIAIVPAIAVIYFAGEKGISNLMIWSQVVLSAQLTFAVVPLIQFTSDRAKMGVFVNGLGVRTLGWASALLIFLLNAYLIYRQVRGDV
jgi:manganese transport protein